MVTPRPSVTAAVDVFLDQLVGLDPAGQAKAAIAHALACKLEQAQDSVSGAVAQAAPATARELTVVLDALVAGQRVDDELLDAILKGNR